MAWNCTFCITGEVVCFGSIQSIAFSTASMVADVILELGEFERVDGKVLHTGGPPRRMHTVVER